LKRFLSCLNSIALRAKTPLQQDFSFFSKGFSIFRITVFLQFGENFYFMRIILKVRIETGMRIIVRKIEADSILNGRKGEGTDQSEWQEQNQPIKAKNFFYE